MRTILLFAMLFSARQIFDESIPGLGIDDYERGPVRPGQEFYDDELDYPWQFEKEEVPNPIEREDTETI